MKNNVMGIALLLICLCLWFSAPFLAINMLTLDDQPTASELFGEELTQYFDLSESPVYWVAIGVMAAVVLGLVFALMGKSGMMRLMALLGELPILWGIWQMYMWTEGNQFFMDTMGSGFWGMAILLAAVVVFGSMKRSAE